MIIQALVKLEKKRNFRIVEFSYERVIYAVKLCIVKGQHKAVWCTVSLATWTVVEDDLDKTIVVFHRKNAAMRAVVHPAMIKVANVAHLENDNLILPNTTFVLNHLESTRSASRKKKNSPDSDERFVSHSHRRQHQNFQKMASFSPIIEKGGALFIAKIVPRTLFDALDLVMTMSGA